MNSNTMKKAVVLLAAIAIVLAVCPAVSAGSDEVTIVTSWKDLTDGINAIPADGVGHFSIKGEIKISDAPLEYQKAIEILNGKKIYITGNSYKDTDNATIKPSLNAENLCNFFKIDGNSLLDIRGESANTLLKLIGGSAEYGGAIYVGTNGLLSADMLDIEDCKATKDGGAIYFAENYPDAAKEHKISNSTINNNTAGNNGGAIYVGKGSNAPLSQNKIEKNVAQNKGGAVYCCDGSVVRINNSTKTAYIKSNNAHLSGAGVYAENGSTVLVDGTAYIGGNTLLNDGDSSLSGIQDDLHLLSPTTLKLVDNGQYLKDGASINITYEFGSDENLPVQITEDWENAEDCGKYFHSDQGFTVEYVSSTNHNLQLSHTHDNINFSKILTNNYLGTCSGVLSSGNYVLGGPVANNADNITIPSGAVVNLCLNGHLLRGNGEGPTITVENGATLNLYDCYDYDRSSNKSGTWVQYNHYFLNNSDTGLWKHVGETYGSGGTAYYGGVITSKETDTSRPGILNEGTVTIYGGNLFGNASSNGAAIENKGNLTIKGGVIQGNAGEHGAVYTSNSGNLTVGGTAVIVKNTDGTAKTNYRNVYLQSGKTVDVVDPMRPAYIGVTLENETGNITGEENADCSPYFYCDDSYASMQHNLNEYFPDDEYSSEDISDEESSRENFYISSSTDASNKGIEVEKSSGGKYIVKVVLNSDTSNAVKYEYETDGTTTTGYTDTVSDAVSKIPQKGTVTLLRNITAQIYANTLIIGSGKDITLDLNGKVLMQPISVDGTLTINDNTSVVHRFSDYNNFWNLAEESGSHEVTGGVIVAGYASQDFGKTLSTGISVSNGGTVIMNGGNVLGNFVGVNISQNGSFTLNNGSIAGNSASSSNGGGVRDKGSFTMNGGSIDHNNARSGNIGAGGISVTNGGSLTMTGGVIEENFALSTSTGGVSSVGGVNVSSGSFTMTGGKIINNHGAGNTGGINSSSTPEIGGTAVIEGNTSGDENTNSNYTGNIITVSTTTPFVSGAKIWVTTSTVPTSENPVAITGNNSENYSNYFRSDDTTCHIIDDVSGADHTVKLALGNCYSVKYNGGEGVSGEAPVDDKQYISGNTVTVLGKGTLVKVGYKFAGWTDETNTYQEGDTFTITGDVTLTAKWEKSDDTFPVTDDEIESAANLVISTPADLINFRNASKGTSPYSTSHTFSGKIVSLAKDIHLNGSDFASSFESQTGLIVLKKEGKTFYLGTGSPAEDSEVTFGSLNWSRSGSWYEKDAGSKHYTEITQPSELTLWTSAFSSSPASDEEEIDASSTFQGTFDGCGHSISGIVSTTNGFMGAGSDCTIRNVTLKSCAIATLKNYSGIFMGISSNGIFDGCSVKDSQIIAYNKRDIGGFIGRADQDITLRNCSLSNCVVSTVSTATSSSSASNGYVGGLIGDAIHDYSTENTCSISGCTVSFSTIQSLGPYAGGLAGYMGKNCTIASSSVTNSVIASIGTNNTYGGSSVGGLIGSADYSFSCTGCSVLHSEISGVVSNIGGIAGALLGGTKNKDSTISDAVVRNCMIGIISSKSKANHYIGGIAGITHTDEVVLKKYYHIRNTGVSDCWIGSKAENTSEAIGTAIGVGSADPESAEQVTASGVYLYADKIDEDKFNTSCTRKNAEGTWNGVYAKAPSAETVLDSVYGTFLTSSGWERGIGYGYGSAMPSYTITYSGVESSENLPSSGVFDAVVSVPAPSKGGFEFAGWVVSSGLAPKCAKWGTSESTVTTKIADASTVCKGDSASSPVYFKNIAPSGQVTLTAVWDPVKYSVKYNGGEGVSGKAPVDSKKYVSGDTVTVLGKGTLVKDGYNFAGWTDGTNTYQEGDTFTITEDVTLTAVWKLVKYSSSSSSITSFTAVKNGNDFTFTNAVVVTKATLPGATSAKITNNGSGTGWYNFNLTAPGFTGNGTMQFTVPLDVLKAKGFETGDVGLYHQENGEWVLKPTYLLSTDNSKAYYKGTFDSCSPFMINFEKDATATTSSKTVSEEKPATDTKKIETTPVTQDDSSKTTQKTTETVKTTAETTKSPFPVLGILAGLGAAAVLMKRRK